MSKAFTRESDHDEDEVQVPPLPASAQGKNYMTRQGYDRLRTELLDLMDNERPKVVESVHWAASNGDRSENGDYIYGKKRLREIDRRIRFLTHRLEMVELVDPTVHLGSDQIFFGACVTYERHSGERVTVTILGIDEANSANSEITWVSPVARSLLKAKVGDEVVLHTPSGRESVDVLAVSYGQV